MSFTPINSSLMKTALHEFSNLLTSLVGPSGNMCLLNSSVDSLTLTSSSSRLISNISFSNPIFQFVIQCIKSQTDRYGDGGLYSGIFLSKLLAQLSDESIPKSTVCSILTELGSISQSEIKNSSQLQIRIDLQKIQPLIAVAQSVLFSKSSTRRDQTRAELVHVNLQVTLLVKAFLLTEATPGNVLLRVHEGSEYQHLFEGVLYSSVDEECEVIGKNPWHSASVLLFSVMLSDQIDSKEKESSIHELAMKREAQLQAAQLFIEKAISCGIQVIACQKVVHPMLLLKLRRKGILVLQRLGKCTALAVEKLSGAIPISSLSSSSLESLLSLKGCLGKVQSIQHCGENFVLLEGDCNPGLCTLLLSSSTKESSAELKVVAQQALASLSQVVLDKAACPGAGCTEVYLCCFLSREVKRRKKDLCKKLKCEPSQLYAVLKWFQEGLLSAAGLDFTSGKLSNDSVYHHAWRGAKDKNAVVSDDVRCNCGLLNSVDVNTAQGGWSIMNSEPSGLLTIDADKVSCTPDTKLLSSYSVLDICSTKRNAIGLILDSCIAIMNIGAVVTRIE